MGYRIVYEKEKKQSRWKFRIFLFSAFFLLFLVLSAIRYTSGDTAESVQSYKVRFGQALETMTGKLIQGEPIGDALEAFRWDLANEEDLS